MPAVPAVGLVLAGLAAGSLPCPAAEAAAAPARRPNILFILTDDLGWGDVGIFFQNARGAAGQGAVPCHRTPVLDGMARSGAMLPHHYCPAPVCAPSRASLLLGVHQGHANVRDNQFDKALEDNHTLATVLRQAGYATAAIGKWGLQGQGTAPDWPAHPLKRGFDHFYGYIRHVDGHEHYPKETPYRNKGTCQLWEDNVNVVGTLDKCYTADLFTARAKQWITGQRKAAPQQPFFLYLAYDTPHASTELPTQAYPAGGGVAGGLQWLGTPGHMISTASGIIDSWVHPDYALATWQHQGARAAWPEVYKRYATSVRRIDDGVGDLLQLLKDLQIEKDTLVVFTSDNGPSQESYLKEPLEADFFASFGPFDGIKRDCWEGGLRVPAIACWPGTIPAGRVVERPCAAWDWLPTCAEAAGLPAPARADGVSLLAPLTGIGVQPEDEPLYFEYHVKGRTPAYEAFAPAHRHRLRNQMQALRLGDYVGVRYDVKSHRDPFEIYQVVQDPKEERDLAASRPDLQVRLHEQALQMRRPDDQAPRPYDSELVPAVPDQAVVGGLEWQLFDGSFPWVPQVALLRPAAAGRAPAPDQVERPKERDGAVCLQGYLRIPRPGAYTFFLATDTGSLLRIHAATVIDADRGYPSGSERSATMRLAAGLHPFLLTVLHSRLRAPALTWEWSGPELPRQPLPAAAFQRAAAPGR